MSDCCLTPTQQFSAISWREHVNFQWDDAEVYLILEWNIIVRGWTCHPTLTHFPDSEPTSLCSFSLMVPRLAEKQQIPIFGFT